LLLNGKALDRHMRICIGKCSFWAGLVAAALASAALAEDDGDPAPASLPKALVEQLVADPCPVLEEIFRTSDDPKDTCAKLRRANGQLRVRLTLKDGQDLVDLTRVGQRCPGDIVAADIRPKKVPRWVSYVAVTVQAADKRTLVFGGGLTSIKAGTDGRLESKSGCGPAVAGKVRLVDGKWKLLQRRSEGCSE